MKRLQNMVKMIKVGEAWSWTQLWKWAGGELKMAKKMVERLQEAHLKVRLHCSALHWSPAISLCAAITCLFRQFPSRQSIFNNGVSFCPGWRSRWRFSTHLFRSFEKRKVAGHSLQLNFTLGKRFWQNDDAEIIGHYDEKMILSYHVYQLLSFYFSMSCHVLV